MSVPLSGGHSFCSCITPNTGLFVYLVDPQRMSYGYGYSSSLILSWNCPCALQRLSHNRWVAIIISSTTSGVGVILLIKYPSWTKPENRNRFAIFYRAYHMGRDQGRRTFCLQPRLDLETPGVSLQLRSIGATPFERVLAPAVKLQRGELSQLPKNEVGLTSLLVLGPKLL